MGFFALGFFVMDDHEVKVSCFVHLVAAILLKSGVYAPFMGDNIPVLLMSEEDHKAGSFDGQAMCTGRQVTWRKRTSGTIAMTVKPAVTVDREKTYRARRPGNGRW
jgi:hypothetical protein